MMEHLTYYIYQDEYEELIHADRSDVPAYGSG